MLNWLSSVEGTNMRRVVAVALMGVMWQTTIAGAASLSPRAQRGFNFAKANCSRCHSIDKATPSRLASAPPFRILHYRYPVDSLEEALGEGIVTGYPHMPEFQLEPDQVEDLVAFLKSLEK